MKFLLFFLTLTFQTLSYSQTYTCSDLNTSEVTCSYEGVTGLELIPELNPSQIQRLYIRSSSIVLMTDAEFEGEVYKECWSTSHSLTSTLFLYCTQNTTDPGEIPKLIMEKTLLLKN